MGEWLIVPLRDLPRAHLVAPDSGGFYKGTSHCVARYTTTQVSKRAERTVHQTKAVGPAVELDKEVRVCAGDPNG